MAERSFHKEVELLGLQAGEEFRGEAIVAVTKALLESGVSYIGGYPGSPVSTLLEIQLVLQQLFYKFCQFPRQVLVLRVVRCE